VLRGGLELPVVEMSKKLHAQSPQCG
jgi:hypothetical protein